MIDFFLSNKILIILVDVAGVWLGFWVYFANRREKINQLFALMMSLALLWITLCYFSGVSIGNLSLSLLLGRLAYGTTIIFLIPFYFFSLEFIKREEKFKYLKLFIPVCSIVIFFLSVFSEFMATKMVPIKIMKVFIGVVPVLGQGKFIYFGLILFVAMLVLIRFIEQYLKSTKIEKIKLGYFLLGISVFIVINLIFNVIWAFWLGDARYYQLGNYSVIIFLGFTAYAIVKRQLFGIRVVLTQLLVGLIALLLFVNFITSVSSFEYIWKGFLLVAFMVAGILLVKSIKKEIRQKEELDRLATEIAITNIRLESAYKKLKKLDDAKSEFLSIASHQLRTPLATIKGYTSMMLEGDYGKLPKKALEPIQNTYQATERLIGLVNTLLNISRIEAGKVQFEPSVVSLEYLISDVIRELLPQTQNKKLYLRFEKPATALPRMSLDQDKIRQVLVNVIDNAIKYTEQGGIVVKLDVVESLGGKIVRISVTDTGDGMEKEEISGLFESFSRGGAGMKSWVEGAGLGLYIARKFVEMHEGKIWAESAGKGKGSKLTIELPV